MSEILSPITDKYWQHHAENGKLVETGRYWRYTLKFYKIDHQIGWIKYKYRMFCFCPGYVAPVISLNLEYTSKRACFLGLQEEDGHLNCGRVEKDMPYEDFREWAMVFVKERLEEAKRRHFYAKSGASRNIYYRNRI